MISGSGRNSCAFLSEHTRMKSSAPGFNLLLAFLMIVVSLKAVSPALAAQTQIQYLSGTDKDNTVPWNFSVSSGRNAGVVTTIPVPSCWEMQGFGTYQYGQNGSVSNAETGFYTNTFAVPSAWAGKKIFLVFE